MKLILIRHGETDWNKARRFQGQTDTELNDTGWRQAAAVAHRLADVPLARIMSSPLKRAWQTAEAIAQHHALPVERTAALQELYLGSWQGRTYEAISAECPDVHAALVAPHGGETVHDVAARLRPWLGQLSAETGQSNRPIALVTHGVIVQVCLCLGQNIPVTQYQQFKIGNVSIQPLDLDWSHGRSHR